jgi:hypothetical protein
MEIIQRLAGLTIGNSGSSNDSVLGYNFKYEDDDEDDGTEEMYADMLDNIIKESELEHINTRNGTLITVCTVDKLNDELKAEKSKNIFGNYLTEAEIIYTSPNVNFEKTEESQKYTASPAYSTNDVNSNDLYSTNNGKQTSTKDTTEDMQCVVPNTLPVLPSPSKEASGFMFQEPGTEVGYINEDPVDVILKQLSIVLKNILVSGQEKPLNTSDLIMQAAVSLLAQCNSRLISFLDKALELSKHRLIPGKSSVGADGKLNQTWYRIIGPGVDCSFSAHHGMEKFPHYVKRIEVEPISDKK